MVHTEELYHHGILGQKWGIRRYQNEDGSLTSEGRKHYQTRNDAIQKSKNVINEGNKLIKSDKRLQADFTKNFKNVDDWDFFVEVCNDYGIDTSIFDMKWEDEQQFYKDNGKSIDIGDKIARKILKEKGMFEQIF